MRRLADWEERINNLFATARTRAHAWGTFDCLLFAADGFHAVTGTDPAAPYRGTYADESGAYAALAVWLGRDIPRVGALAAAAERIAVEHNCGEVPRARARRGDIGVVLGEAHECLAVVGPTGRHLWSVAPRGLYRVPIEAGIRFWAVG